MKCFLYFRTYVTVHLLLIPKKTVNNLGSTRIEYNLFSAESPSSNDHDDCKMLCNVTVLTDVADQKPSTSSMVDSDTSFQATTSVPAAAAPASSTDAHNEHEPATNTATPATSSATVQRHKRKQQKSNTAEDDSQLFNKWLSSEIEKNSVKIRLMKAKTEFIEAKKEFIDLKKVKTAYEIQSLTHPTDGSAVFISEL